MLNIVPRLTSFKKKTRRRIAASRLTLAYRSLCKRRSVKPGFTEARPDGKETAASSLAPKSTASKNLVPKNTDSISTVSIVIPMLNEADNLAALIEPLKQLDPPPHQVVFVDGGSKDGTVDIAKMLTSDQNSTIAWQVLESAAGRATQMNVGAAQASSDTLLFLHADTRLPTSAIAQVQQAISRADWGRFEVRLDSRHPLLWVVSHMMNIRSRLTGIATGDQAIFIKKELFLQLGGFPKLPLMEDIELCKMLKRVNANPACVKAKVITSARRWEVNGVVSTIVLMWRLRFAYWCGVAPETLKHRYRNHDG